MSSNSWKQRRTKLSETSTSSASLVAITQGELMDNIQGAKVFYLFLGPPRASNSKLEIFVENELALSWDYPKANLVQVLRNKDYGLREMIRDKRSFDYEAYFFNGGRD